MRDQDLPGDRIRRVRNRYAGESAGIMTRKYLLGFDIGGTKCAVILGQSSGDEISILARTAFPTGTEHGPEYTLGMLESTARQMVADNGLAIVDIRSIGISCGGPLDSRRGLILGPPNLPGWDNVPIVERFESAFDIPVRLQNDANACALAEWKWGAGRGTRNMIFLTFGTGIGAGLILDGRLYSGTNDLAGEAGHVRLAEDGPMGYGKRGSFEGFCSGSGIAQSAKDLVRERWSRGETVSFCRDEAELERLSAQTVADAARAGDLLAKSIFDRTAHYLGRGLSMLIDILNPEAIVIGSIFVRAHDLLWPITEQVIAEEALPLSAGVCRVLPAALGESLGDYASLSVAEE
ncbi:MAG: ROK family protein [Armatimonadota bacterium]